VALKELVGKRGEKVRGKRKWEVVTKITATILTLQTANLRCYI
jgi:hypothetical protein